ncbi:MAG: hypothetical protein GY797_11705 [Deltaproteobacteria bacterium]|nr:hypothetical protein [Deltaproteobacteria bacterium]
MRLWHLRAGWYWGETGTFLSVDPVESEPPYLYVRGNPVNLVDPSGYISECKNSKCRVEIFSNTALGSLKSGLIFQRGNGNPFFGHFGIIFTNEKGEIHVIDAAPNEDGFIGVRGPVEDQNNPALGGLVEVTSWPNAMVTVAEGEEVCGKWKCIKDKMELIAQRNIRWMPWGPNSNSAAYTALKACSLPTVKPVLDMYSKLPWRNHPGWGMHLLPLPPILLYPPSCIDHPELCYGNITDL